MAQIVDLESDPQFKALDVALVSISTDTVQELQSVAAQWKINSPILSDRGGRVSGAYGALKWAHGSEPGHTFVLVGVDGKVLWIRDYGAPQNGGLMYVPVPVLVKEIAQRLPQA